MKIASKIPFPRKEWRAMRRARMTPVIKTIIVAIVAVLKDNHMGERFISFIFHHLFIPCSAKISWASSVSRNLIEDAASCSFFVSVIIEAGYMLGLCSYFFTVTIIFIFLDSTASI